jgi:hypothetical protein
LSCAIGVPGSRHPPRRLRVGRRRRDAPGDFEQHALLRRGDPDPVVVCDGGPPLRPWCDDGLPSGVLPRFVWARGYPPAPVCVRAGGPAILLIYAGTARTNQRFSARRHSSPNPAHISGGGWRQTIGRGTSSRTSNTTWSPSRPTGRTNSDVKGQLVHSFLRSATT